MSLPDNTALVDNKGQPTRPWYAWLSDADKLLTALKGSGTTAQRPTTFLYVGRPYFDTTLGKPVWLESVGPSVWVDATGTPV